MSFAASLCEVHDTAECPCKTFNLKVSICTAAIYNDVGRVRELLAQKARAAQAQDDHGYTALHYAAQHGHVAIMALLLDRGRADPNAAACGCMPLHRAAFAGRIAACKMLLDVGARVGAVDSTTGDMRTPVLKAAWQGHPAVVELLLAHGADGAARDPGTGLTPAQLLAGHRAPAQAPSLEPQPPGNSCVTAGAGDPDDGRDGSATVAAAPAAPASAAAMATRRGTARRGLGRGVIALADLGAGAAFGTAPQLPSAVPAVGSAAVQPTRPVQVAALVPSSPSGPAMPAATPPAPATVAVAAAAAVASAPAPTVETRQVAASSAAEEFGMECPLCGVSVLSVDRIPCCGALCCDRCIISQQMRPMALSTTLCESNRQPTRCCALCKADTT